MLRRSRTFALRENPAADLPCGTGIGAAMTASATLSRDLQSEIERRFCESVGTDSRDSRAHRHRSGASGGDLRNFFSPRKTAFRAPILRRAGDAESAVKRLHARAHTHFYAVKKCPFHRHFCNRAKFSRVGRPARAARATRGDCASRCIAPAARARVACTRFVNAEAVFFVLL
jgi:hypothetical protein